MVDVHMGDHQRTDMANGEINGEIRRTRAVTGFRALEQAAINQNAGTANDQLVARTGYT